MLPSIDVFSMPFMPSIFPQGLWGRQRSIFSSPGSNVQASPIAARRSSLEERRRPAAKFEHVISPGTDRIEEGDEEEDGEEGEGGEFYADNREDEAGELSPLLPIFSAAHLGTCPSSVLNTWSAVCSPLP